MFKKLSKKFGSKSSSPALASSPPPAGSATPTAAVPSSLAPTNASTSTISINVSPTFSNGSSGKSSPPSGHSSNPPLLLSSSPPPDPAPPGAASILAGTPLSSMTEESKTLARNKRSSSSSVRLVSTNDAGIPASTFTSSSAGNGNAANVAGKVAAESATVVNGLIQFTGSSSGSEDDTEEYLQQHPGEFTRADLLKPVPSLLDSPTLPPTPSISAVLAVPLSLSPPPSSSSSSSSTPSSSNASTLSNKQALFIHKLRLCCVKFEWSREEGMLTPNGAVTPISASGSSPNNISSALASKDQKAKEIKRQQLLDLLDFLARAKNFWNDITLIEFFNMIQTNLFRSLPPRYSASELSSSCSTSGSSPQAPANQGEDEEPVYEPSWSHLQIIYELFLRFIVANDLDIRLLKRFIHSAFVLRLLELFDSEDSRERDYLKTILHRIYAKFMSLRAFIRKAINHVFYSFIYNDCPTSLSGSSLSINAMSLTTSSQTDYLSSASTLSSFVYQKLVESSASELSKVLTTSSSSSSLVPLTIGSSPLISSILNASSTASSSPALLPASQTFTPSVMYYTGPHQGIAELLEILGSIINGFALPLKHEHQQFLRRVLLPLHSVSTLSVYHSQLSYCISQFVDKDVTLSSCVLQGLCKYWPRTSTSKQVLFLNELETILELTSQEEFSAPIAPVATAVASVSAGSAAAAVPTAAVAIQASSAPASATSNTVTLSSAAAVIATNALSHTSAPPSFHSFASSSNSVAQAVAQLLYYCITSSHFQVAERALFLWHNDYVGHLLAQHRQVVLPILYPALQAAHHPFVSSLPRIVPALCTSSIDLIPPIRIDGVCISAPATQRLTSSSLGDECYEKTFQVPVSDGAVNGDVANAHSQSPENQRGCNIGNWNSTVNTLTLNVLKIFEDLDPQLVKECQDKYEARVEQERQQRVEASRAWSIIAAMSQSTLEDLRNKNAES